MLGIDPGTRVAGYGVLDVVPGQTPTLVGCGPIHLPIAPMGRRLESLHRELTRILLEHRPHVLAVETVFQGKSFQSVVKVGEARGVVLLLAQLHGLAIHEFTPASVKKTVTGNGRATKSQVQRMVTRILGLSETPAPVDVSDALAIAFCYGQRVWRDRLGAGAPGASARRRSRAAESRRWEALIARRAAAGGSSGRGES